MHITFRTAFAGFALSAAMVLGSAALAETISFKADLKPLPPVESKGSGTLTATYDTASKSLNYTVNYSGLSGARPPRISTVPRQPARTPGVVVPVTGSVASPIKGSATLTDAQAADLTADRWYFNVHTAANKGGEIRGQVVKGK
jgi:hypothetical protein